jgi:type I restriction enzyme R subunit
MRRASLNIEPNFEEVTEGEEVSYKERLKTKCGTIEALVGSEKKINLIAHDNIEQYEKSRK